MPGENGLYNSGGRTLPPYAQVAWFSSASRCVRQEITRRIIELMVGYLGNSVNSLSANAINSIPAAKIHIIFETAMKIREFLLQLFGLFE